MFISRKKQRIRSLLHGAAKNVQADSEWVRNLRCTLSMQVENSMPPKALQSQTTWFSFAKIVVSRKFIPTVGAPLLAVFSAIGIVAGASIASVSAAENSIPGDFLFPVKLVTEQTRLMLATDKTERIKLKTKFVGRRIEEMKRIVSSDVSRKEERLREASNLLKRELDTVKNQLDEASRASRGEAVVAAKIVDEKSTEIAQGLKEVKTVIPEEVRVDVKEAEVAAVNTGVQAVQVLVDSQVKDHQPSDRPELVQTMLNKIKDVQETIQDTAQTLVLTGLVPTSTVEAVLSPTGTKAVREKLLQETQKNSESTDVTTSSLMKIQDAQTSLKEVKQLLGEHRLAEASSKLVEASQSVSAVELRTPQGVTSAEHLGLARATSSISFEASTSTVDGSRQQPTQTVSAEPPLASSTVSGASTSGTVRDGSR